MKIITIHDAFTNCGISCFDDPQHEIHQHPECWGCQRTRATTYAGALAFTTTPDQPDYQQLIAAECDAIKEMLLTKNRKYGNSALEPVRIVSKADPMEQIAVRIDDKLSRLKSAQVDDDEGADELDGDIVGYFILRLVLRRLLRDQKVDA